MTTGQQAANTGMAVAFVAAAVVALAALWDVRDARPVLLTVVVPSQYAGWVVVWECAGGEALAGSLVGGRRYALTTDDQGAVCLADAIPASGYTAHYRHQTGLPRTLERSLFFRVDPATVYPDTPRSPTIDAWIGTAGDARYDVA